jgi:hypothetical protein
VNIGKERRTVVIEPIEWPEEPANPDPPPDRERTPEPEPIREPAPEPVGSARP